MIRPVHPSVPTYIIDRVLARRHVMTPDKEIVAMIRKAIVAQMAGPDRDAWTPTIRRQTVRYALERHHANRAEAEAVGCGESDTAWLRRMVSTYGHGSF